MDAGQRRLQQCSDPEVFENLLRAQGLDCQLLSLDADGQRARLRFTGNFQGQRVIWNCSLSTLTALGMQRNFIDVGEQGKKDRPIDIGLDLAVIDAAAIRKTIIMVRQYKLLKPGRHEFGSGRDT